MRDFIMGHPSNDIDIATDATPQEIMDLFPKTISVGAKFGVVIVMMKGHHFEVATFRKDLEYDGRRPQKVEFSHAKEDAERRDFTINGMFYNPLKEEILDYVGGKKDIEEGIIRTIGDPKERFREDRLRLIRAIRFSCKFHFKIDKATEEAIKEFAPTLLASVSMERIWQELCKMRPSFPKALMELHRLHILQTIFPDLSLSIKMDALQEYPKNCPTLLCLMTLFEDLPLKKWIEIGRYLKVPGEEIKLVEFFHQSQEILMKEIEEVPLWNLAHFYSHPASQMILEMIAARFPEDKRFTFIKTHASHRHKLHDDICRIEKKSPVINSDFLMRHGVKPGPEMGKILLVAEQIAINERLHYPEDILHRLRRLSLL